MTNLNDPHIQKPIVPSIMDIRSSIEFQTLIHERNLTKLYALFIIPLYKELSTLYNDMKISTAQYETRMALIMRVLQLIEDVISEKQLNNKTTLFFINEIKMPSFHLKIMKGLLHTEHIYSSFISIGDPSHIDAQLIDEQKADSLFIITKTTDEKIVNFPYLHGVKVRYLSYYKLEQLINSLPSFADESFQLYNWLCATQSIEEENH